MEERLTTMIEQNRYDIKHSVAFKGLKKTVEETQRDHAADTIMRCFRGARLICIYVYSYVFRFHPFCSHTFW